MLIVDKNVDQTIGDAGRFRTAISATLLPRAIDEVVAEARIRGITVCLSLEELLDENQFAFNPGHRYTVPNGGQDDEYIPIYSMIVEQREWHQEQLLLSEIFPKHSQGLTLSEGIFLVTGTMYDRWSKGIICFGSWREHVLGGQIEVPMVRLSADDQNTILVDWIDLDAYVDEATVWWVTKRQRAEDKD